MSTQHCVQVPNIHSGAELAMGGAHTMVLGQAGTVSTWGSNHHGALGLGIGTSSDAHESVRLPKLSCSQVHAVHAKHVVLHANANKNF